MTTFLRLLKDTDKVSALESSIRSYAQGAPDPERTFRVDPDKFRKVPNTPFAYWVDDSIRDLFQKLPPFESDGRTVRVGLQTSDDFRFVRTWWEVDADRRLDPGLGGAPDWKTDLPAFQAWCRNRTRQGKYWVPFAKGGEYSPYYSDIHLVVNWKDEGEEMKAFSGSVIRNEDYYFRPGVTWPLRASRFNPYPLPAGSIFSVRGYSFFVYDADYSMALLWANSRIVDALFKTLLGRSDYPEFIVGVLSQIPFAFPNDFDASNTVYPTLNKAMSKFSADPSFLLYNGRDLDNEKGQDLMPAQFDNAISEAYGLTKFQVDGLSLLLGSELPMVTASIVDTIQYTIDSLFGLFFGRFNTRFFINTKYTRIGLSDSFFAPLPVVQPVALIDVNGLPATSGNIVSEEWLRARPDAISLPPPGSVARPSIPDSEYPIPIPWDGILAEDPDNPDDLVARIRLVLRVLHGDDAEQHEMDLAEGLGVKNLRDYIADPMGFFESHLKTYSKSRRKAPIYWPLSTKSGGYTVWVYYPRLTDATLYAVHELARKKVEMLDLERAELACRKDRSRAEQQRFDQVSRDAGEVRDFAQEVLRIAGLPYKPDHDDGVPICAAPLHGLFRHSLWSKYLKETWEELEEGTYDWAHLAYALWPERVRGKAKADRSLAIAHGLENQK